METLNAPLYDTHFHLDLEDNAEEIYNNALSVGVKKMNLIACDLEDAKRHQKTSETFEEMFFSAGIHPHHAESWTGTCDPFIPYLDHPKCLAVGEIGLDFYYHKDPEHIRLQTEIFEAFLQVSKEKQMPAIIHCREAFDECYHSLKTILKGEQDFVAHCYTGDSDWAKKFLDLGAYISYSGIVTFKSAKDLQASAKIIPADRFLIETDSPYLAPVPFRGRRNQPAYVKHVCEKLAELREQSFEEIAAQSFANALKAFPRKA